MPQVEALQPLPRDAVAETSFEPAGPVAVKLTPVAVSGPAFVNVATHVALSPTRPDAGAVERVSWVSVFGGGGGAGAFHVTVASFEVASKRVTNAETTSVPVWELGYVKV